MTGAHSILVIEDDDAIRRGLDEALTSEGYRVECAADGQQGLALGLTRDPDLIVLDLMMPGLDGFEVLERLRADHVQTPVLILTAKGLEADRVRGLGLGADYYMVKPFGLAELLARIEARLRSWDRERGRGQEQALRIGNLVVDFVAMSATRDGSAITLTPLEFDLLRTMSRHEGRAMSRADLLREVWKDESVVARVVDTAMVGLRKKIEPNPSEPKHLVSVRGVGYRFQR